MTIPVVVPDAYCPVLFGKNLAPLSEIDYNHPLKFNYGTKQEKDCFDLLNRAYVEARYDPDYKITKKQLEYLAKRVKLLQRLTKKICKEKIESFVASPACALGGHGNLNLKFRRCRRK